MDKNNQSATMIELSDEALANVMGGDGYGGGGSQGDCGDNSWNHGYGNRGPLGLFGGGLGGLNNGGPLGLLGGGLNNNGGLLGGLGLPLGI